MNESFWAKRFPTLLGLFLISISIGITSYLANRPQLFNPRAQENLFIEDLRISNQTTNSLSISFRTKEKQAVQLRFGTTLKDANVLFDDRDEIGGASRSYKTHHFTAEDLAAGQQYVFSIVSNTQILDNNGLGFTAVTARGAAAIQEPGNRIPPIGGTIITQTSSEVTDALVFVIIEGVTNLSATVSQGMFFMPLGTVYLADLTGPYAFRGDEVFLIETVDEYGVKTAATVPFGSHESVELAMLGSTQNVLSQEERSASGFQKGPQALPQKEDLRPQIYSPEQGDFIIDAKPLFRGSGKPNQRVEIVVESDPQKAEISTDKNGQWTFQPNLPLEPGQHKVTVRFFDGSNLSQVLEREFQVLADGSQVEEPATPSSTPVVSRFPTEVPVPTKAPIPERMGSVAPTVFILGVGTLISLLGILVLGIH